MMHHQAATQTAVLDSVKGAGVPQTSPRTLGEAWPIFVRHASPRVVLVVTPAALVARLALGHWAPADLLVVALITALWPLQEWLIHVYILHFKPVRFFGRQIDFPVPREHRAHHRDPWNYHILFIPFHSFLYTIPLELLLWFRLAPTPALAMTGFAYTFLLTLHYEWIHFLIHTRVTPRTRYYQRIWRNHRLHHFKNEQYWFGVTRLEADRVLRTAPDPDAVPISPTARTLGVVGT